MGFQQLQRAAAHREALNQVAFSAHQNHQEDIVPGDFLILNQKPQHHLEAQAMIQAEDPFSQFQYQYHGEAGDIMAQDMDLVLDYLASSGQ